MLLWLAYEKHINSNNENIIFIGDQSNSDSASYVILLMDIDFSLWNLWTYV